MSERLFAINDRAPGAAGPDACAALPALEVDDLTFAYPDTAAPVLSACSWTVPEGAFALLVGGTGSGKSTLLSLCKPQIAPAGERTGAVRVFGRAAEELSDAESARTIGYVFQNPESQIVCDSVWHEMAFGLENLGTPQDEMRRRVAETSYFFGMEDWFHAEADTLSGGKKQLLALASTLAMRPRLLLLDEPTAQLDPIAEKSFLHALFRVNRELGCTVVVATHRPRAMLSYATCAFELVDGCVRELADPSILEGRASLLRGDASEKGGVGRGGAAVLGGENPLAVGASAASRPSSVEASERPGRRTPSRANADTPAIALAGAWFRYPEGEGWVLRGLDLNVRVGEIHAIVGGNGCGKSTLLGVLAKTRKLKRGKLRRGSDSAVLLPQNPKSLFVAETVLDELRESAAAVRADDARVQEALEECGLDGRSELHPYDLSGGQQQLLALAKFLLLEPDFLLLDEPTKGLDLASRRMMARRLRALASRGKTVVMATHDLDFAEQVADAVSMMFDGEIACTQPAREFFADNIYYRP